MPAVFQIIGQILRHLFGQRRYQHPLASGRSRVDLPNEVVNLSLYRPHNDLRIEQTGRADNLLDDLTRARELVFARRRRDINDLVQPLVELIEVQRTVVIGARQAEAVFDQTFFLRARSP